MAKEKGCLVPIQLLSCPAAQAKLLAATLVAANNQLLAAMTKVVANNQLLAATYVAANSFIIS
jgi:hypothetical protein